MLFNLLTAWNLAAEMYEDRTLGLQLDPFVNQQITNGITGKWLTPANRARALDTFVLAEQPMLPPGLDVRAQQFSDHLKWWSDIAPDLGARTMGRYRPDEWFDLAQPISAGLASRGIEGDPDHIRYMATELQKMDENRRGAISDEYFRSVEHEFDIAWLMCEFARRRTPTFGSSLSPTGEPLQMTAGAVDLVKFYFDNQVRVAAPRSFSEGVDLRENQRVPEWRKQIFAWSEELATGKADFRTHQAANGGRERIHPGQQPSHEVTSEMVGLRHVARWNVRSSISRPSFRAPHRYRTVGRRGNPLRWGDNSRRNDGARSASI